MHLEVAGLSNFSSFFLPAQLKSTGISPLKWGEFVQNMTTINVPQKPEKSTWNSLKYIL